MKSELNTVVLKVEDLTIRHLDNELVSQLSFELHTGQCLAFVGESGSGKTLTARALIGLLPEGLTSTFAVFQLFGTDVRQISQRQWRERRGSQIGFIVQDALAALDPLRKVADEVTETLHIHQGLRSKDRFVRAESLLKNEGISDAAAKVRQYPGQLSGGQRQRALIASVLATQPKIIIADEPTASLDPELAALQLQTLARLKSEGYSIILISHDLAAVSGIADTVLVLKDGHQVEYGDTVTVLGDPQTDYTSELIAAAKRFSLNHELPTDTHQMPTDTAVNDPRRSQKDVASDTIPILSVQGLTKRFRGQTLPAVNNMSFDLFAGETLGIAGPSGSGKSTLARLILGLDNPTHGHVTLFGKPWSTASERYRKIDRHRIQWIPQDPYSSFNPRYRAERVLTEALKTAGRSPRDVVALAASVGLTADQLQLNTVRLSGGQRQRLAIARSLAMKPELLILDEAVSALDVTIQTQILDLLNQLTQEHQLTLFFISHDLGVLQEATDRIMIIDQGSIVETGPTATVFGNPQHPTTRHMVQNSAQFVTITQS